MRTKDLTGQQFGNLTVLYFGGYRNQRATWICKCLCGNVVNISDKKLKNGYNKSCGCLKKDPYSAFITMLENNYKSSARSRSLVYELKFHEFETLVNGDCFYCGAKPSNHFSKDRYSNFVYNGIDRINSDIGYKTNNCVTCCKQCNYAKLDQTSEEFYNWLKRAYEHCCGIGIYG